MNTCYVLNQAAASLCEPETKVYTNSGVENLNKDVDKPLEGGTIERVIAQIDVTFPNSMIESSNSRVGPKTGAFGKIARRSPFDRLTRAAHYVLGIRQHVAGGHGNQSLFRRLASRVRQLTDLLTEPHDVYFPLKGKT